MMEGEVDVRERWADYSDEEVDILGEYDDYEDTVEHVLDKADTAESSRNRSMNRTSKPRIAAEEPAPKKSKIVVNVSPHQRVREFPGEFLCPAGASTVKPATTLKKSVLEKHIESRTHQNGKEKRKLEKLRQQRVAQSCMGKITRSNTQEICLGVA